MPQSQGPETIPPTPSPSTTQTKPTNCYKQNRNSKNGSKLGRKDNDGEKNHTKETTGDWCPSSPINTSPFISSPPSPPFFTHFSPFFHEFIPQQSQRFMSVVPRFNKKNTRELAHFSRNFSINCDLFPLNLN